MTSVHHAQTHTPPPRERPAQAQPVRPCAPDMPEGGAGERTTHSIMLHACGAGGERASAYVSDTVYGDGSLTIHMMVIDPRPVADATRAALAEQVTRRIDEALARAQRAGLPVRGRSG